MKAKRKTFKLDKCPHCLKYFKHLKLHLKRKHPFSTTSQARDFVVEQRELGSNLTETPAAVMQRLAQENTRLGQDKSDLVFKLKEADKFSEFLAGRYQQALNVVEEFGEITQRLSELLVKVERLNDRTSR